jgi:peptidyl-prolyl cis-trans isomerase D
MLQAIRDKTTGWITYVIIGLITVPFALFGVNSYLGGGEGTPPAVVNGQTITLQSFDTAYANYRRQLAQAFGGAIPEYIGSDDILKAQVLTQMIEQSALSQYADKKHYRVSDADLSKLIRSIESFQTDGKFNPEIYQAQVASTGYSTAGFEQEFRRSQAIEQLQTGISATAFTVDSIKNQLTSLANQTRKVRVLTRPTQSGFIDISEQEIEQYFDENTSRFMTREQVRIDYLELGLDAIKASIEITNEQLLNRYELTKDVYSSPEYRSASHILLTMDEDISSEDSDVLRQELSELRNQIEEGANFSELAKTYSQDPGSASSGGSLGEVERGMMVKPFEDTLFELKVGDLSEPVKSSFGWHLIRLDEVSGGETKSFDEVKSDLVDEMRNELAEGQIYDLSESLANLAYEQSDSLEPAAEELGLKLQTSDCFDASSGEGITSNSQIRNAAFSNEVLAQGLNSEAIELSDNRVIFLRVREQKPESQKMLAEVSNQIDMIIRQTKSRDEGAEVGKKALASLSVGKSLDDIASDWKVTAVDPGFISRNSPDIDGNLVRLVFSMNKPDGEQFFEGFSHPDGSYSLIELSAVLSNDSEDDATKVNALTVAKSSAEYQAVLKLLTARAEVVKASPVN